MADDESPLVRDIWISDAGAHTINEDSVSHANLIGVNSQIDHETTFYPSDLFVLNCVKETEIIDTMSVDQFPSDSSLDLLQNSSVSLSSPVVYTNFQQYNDSQYSPPFDSTYHPSLSLSFNNAPEPIYHVRYLSEITNSPVDGNIVNTRKKTKKNVSGRYLKGTHGRHVTIDLPINLPDYPEFYIRVTRLTVPYQNISFIHPYPLFYAPPKKKTHSTVIIKSPSIYYKLNKEDICSHSKQFPNIILTRIKQCQLKQMNTLFILENSDITYPFIGNNAKSKIATYQLKKSQLDFRLVLLCNQTCEFIDLNISCRSNPLLEEEGTECKKLSSTSPCIKF